MVFCYGGYKWVGTSVDTDIERAPKHVLKKIFFFLKKSKLKKQYA